VRGCEASIWLGVVAPKNTPVEIVAELGDAVFASSPADFARLIAEDTEKWAKVIKFAGIKAD
jgi:tripartite-type tricarboxylate transporter receptor subunit TctC